MIKEKKFSSLSLVLILAVAALSLQSCGTTEVAKAQQVTHAAVVDFNDFVQFEKANRDALWHLNPNIKHAADKLRHRTCADCEPNGAKWLGSAIAMVDAYKDNRSPENKANMDTAIAVIQEMINQISEYFLNPQVRQLDPVTAVKYHGTKIVP